jgi:hypothetical protein
VSQPGDPLEREADVMAGQVMRKPQVAVGNDSGRVTAPSDAPVPAGGRELDAVTRAWMEPRFGTRFGSVRIHDGPEAARQASVFAARAYTVGEHVVFGAGQFQPASDVGRGLIAHELAHVIQGRQGRVASTVLRTVDPDTLSCPAKVAGAGADPAADLEALDGRAQGLAESMSILASAAAALNPARSSNSFSRAYQRRMGRPEAVGKMFRNRFSRELFSSEQEASREEVRVIGERFSLIKDFLGGPVSYICRGNGVVFTLGKCRVSCRSEVAAKACIPGDMKSIGICPRFWKLQGDNVRANVLLHEAAHAKLDQRDNSSRSLDQRGRNPHCYHSIVADFFEFPAASDLCPPIRK